MPNLIAYGALLIWPVVTLILFLGLPTRRAIIWSLLIAHLFLPVVANFDLAGLPAMDKASIPTLSTLLLALILAKRGEFKWPQSPWVNGLLLTFVLVGFFNGFFNRDPITILNFVVPGISLYSSISACLEQAIRVAPFVIGMCFIRDERSHRDVLIALAIMALVYSIPILLEIRLSPMLNKWVYNVTRAGWFMQQVRGDGYRASVFLGHGLLVADYLAMSLIALAGLWRAKTRIWGVPVGIITIYLLVILLLNQTLGASILLALIGPAVYFLSTRRFMAFGLAIAILTVTYPVTRSLDLVPVDKVQALANSVSPQRGRSFLVRITNENSLLERAQERPIFGWGGFGRSRIRATSRTGMVQDVSTTDGLWIITFGRFGWVGFIALFGLYCYPIWAAFKLRKRNIPVPTVALVGILLYTIVNFLPNSGESPLVWMIAGGVTGMLVPQLRQAGARRLARRPFGSQPAVSQEASVQAG